jgi:DNA-binding XRE family transcriptional regulator
MAATQNRDDLSAPTDVKIRLRVEVYDALAAERAGVTTVVAQAKLHGIGRQHMFRIRSGNSNPRLPLAMRMAADLGTTVDALFERVVGK